MTPVVHVHFIGRLLEVMRAHGINGKQEKKKAACPTAA
jgi:hypothetical protein